MKDQVFNYAADGEHTRLWQALQGGETGHEKAVQAWLTLQCSAIQGATSAVVIDVQRTANDNSGLADNSGSPLAVWPNKAVPVEMLAGLISQVMKTGKPLVTQLAHKDVGLALPIIDDDKMHAIIALRVHAADDSVLRNTMHQLQWGSSWLARWYLNKDQQSSQLRLESIGDNMGVLANVMSREHYDEAAMALVNELCRLMRCEIACLGRVHKSGIQATHFSNSAQFGKKMNVVRAFENAMDEAADQLAPVCFQEGVSASPVDRISRAHSELADLLDPTGCYLSIPLVLNHECIGAVCIKRGSGAAFTEQDQLRCESLMAFIAVVLDQKRLLDRNVLLRVLDATGDQLQRLLGKGFLGRKLAFISILALVAFFSLAQGEYRLSADARVSPALQRAIVAPFDTFIADAKLRAGDEVSEGDVLVSFDDRDLQLERLRWTGQLNQLQREYEEAIAQHDRSQIAIINAQLEQAQANLELVRSQLDKMVQRAPFNGMIVAGDLTQYLGSAVNKGDVLFEVSPADSMRLFVDVKESRITDIDVGQQGILYLSAIPDQPLPITVTKVTSITNSRDKATFFQVESSIDTKPDNLQPGMEGVAKIVIDERNLFSIWTREMREWIRLKWWRVFG